MLITIRILIFIQALIAISTFDYIMLVYFIIVNLKLNLIFRFFKFKLFYEFTYFTFIIYLLFTEHCAYFI